MVWKFVNRLSSLSLAWERCEDVELLHPKCELICLPWDHQGVAGHETSAFWRKQIKVQIGVVSFLGNVFCPPFLLWVDARSCFYTFNWEISFLSLISLSWMRAVAYAEAYLLPVCFASWCKYQPHLSHSPLSWNVYYNAARIVNSTVRAVRG